MTQPGGVTLQQSEDFPTLVGKVFGLIGESFRALVLNFWTLLGTLALPMLLFAIAFAGVLLANEVGDDSTLVRVLGIVIAAIAGIVGIVVFVFASIACIFIQLYSVRHKKIGIKQAYTLARPFFWRYIVQSIIVVGLIIAGLLLFIVPGLVVAFFILLAPYTLVDKNLQPFDSIKASYELIKKHWKILLAYVVLQLFISLCGVIPVLGKPVTWALSIAYAFILPTIYIKIVTVSKKKVQKRARTKAA